MRIVAFALLGLLLICHSTRSMEQDAMEALLAKQLSEGTADGQDAETLLDGLLGTVATEELTPVTDITDLTRLPSDCELLLTNCKPNTAAVNDTLTTIVDQVHANPGGQEEKFVAANRVLDELRKFAFSSFRDLRMALDNPTLKNMGVLRDITDNLTPYAKAVDKSEEEGTIDFQYVKGIEELGKMAAILGIAFTGCRGFKCEPKVIELQGSYQTLMHNSETTSLAFVHKSLNALQFINSVTLFYENDSFSKGNEFLAQTRAFVVGMEDDTKEILNGIERVLALSTGTIEVANNDQFMLAAQERNDTAEREQWVSENKVLQGKIDNYTKLIADKQQEIDNNLKDIQDERDRTRKDVTAQVTKGSCRNYFFYKKCDGDKVVETTNVISTTNNKLLMFFIRDEHTLATAKTGLVKAKIENSALLAKKAQQIQNAVTKGKMTHAGILGLDMSIAHLRIAHVFFNKMGIYWNDMKDELDAISSAQEATKVIIDDLNTSPDGQVSLVKLRSLVTFILVQLYESVGLEGMRWLRVGYKSVQGYRLFKARVKEIDDLSLQIPVTDAEARDLASKLIKSLNEKRQGDNLEFFKTARNARDRWNAARQLVGDTVQEQAAAAKRNKQE